MEIIRAEQQTILLPESFKLSFYRMPNDEFAIGTEEARQALGYENIKLERLFQEPKNIPVLLRRTGFTSKIEFVATRIPDQSEQVKTQKLEVIKVISLEDFKRLVFYEASKGNERAIRIQSVLLKSVLGAYTNDKVKAEKNTKRDLLEERYDAAHKKVIECIKVDELGDLETEEDILSVAVSLTR